MWASWNLMSRIGGTFLSVLFFRFLVFLPFYLCVIPFLLFVFCFFLCVLLWPFWFFLCPVLCLTSNFFGPSVACCFRLCPSWMSCFSGPSLALFLVLLVLLWSFWPFLGVLLAPFWLSLVLFFAFVRSTLSLFLSPPVKVTLSPSPP